MTPDMNGPVYVLGSLKSCYTYVLEKMLAFGFIRFNLRATSVTYFIVYFSKE